MLARRDPDQDVMAALSGDPAALVHRGFEGEDPAENPIGNRACLPETNELGVRQLLVKKLDHTSWCEGAYPDRIEFIDRGH